MKLTSIKALLLISLLLGTFTLSAQIPFKMARQGQDTVYNKKYNLVCITEPGVKAEINGKPAKVYKTGAFGMAIELSEGDNTINIQLSKGETIEKQEINLFYCTKPKEKKSAKVEKLSERLFYVTSLNGAYLQYGDGGDRLGGSKMSYIDSGIVMKVVGVKGELYKVQLSQNRFAYLPTEYALFTNSESEVINTSSWFVNNTGNSDRLTVSLPARVPYTSWYETDPTKICIDLFGATSNTNWITQAQGLGAIDYVDVQQPDSDVFRIIIKLKEKYSWGYHIGFEGTNLVVKVNHAPKPTLKGMVIGLDAGHGGSSLGAVSATGIYEKDVNMNIVYILKEMLEDKGAKVVLSRDGDYDIAHPERKRIFIENDIDLLISIHNNAGGSPFNTMGTSTYYRYITNRDLASCILNRVLELGYKNYGLIGNFNFSLNAPTEYPNALLEGLFMSSLPEEEILADEANHKKIAQKVVIGLEDYLKKVFGLKKL